MAIGGLRARARGRRLIIDLRVSKRSNVTVAVHRGSRLLRITSRHLLRGRERFIFSRPAARRPLRITVTATSLSGLRSKGRIDLR